MSYLILSTYGESGSRNSGDDLICKSLILLLQRVKGKNIDLDVFSLVDDDVALVNMQRYKAVLVPAMRPTVQGSKIAPQNCLLGNEKECSPSSKDELGGGQSFSVLKKFQGARSIPLLAARKKDCGKQGILHKLKLHKSSCFMERWAVYVFFSQFQLLTLV
ncbi:hypothetical protein [Halobacillus sp. B23F22_1]|uniref:hypothetical protein n=1 Tax=Halobacillus sp. B23F22_1 TaxID=3459514 RepID=UPI00373EF6E1